MALSIRGRRILEDIADGRARMTEEEKRREQYMPTDEAYVRAEIEAKNDLQKSSAYRPVNPFAVDAESLRKKRDRLLKDLEVAKRDPQVQAREKQAISNIDYKLNMVQDPQKARNTLQQMLEGKQRELETNAGKWQKKLLMRDIDEMNQQLTLLDGYILGQNLPDEKTNNVQRMMMATAGEDTDAPKKKSTMDEWLAAYPDAKELTAIESYLPEGKTLEDYAVQESWSKGRRDTNEAARYLVMTDAERRAYDAMDEENKVRFMDAMQMILNERTMNVRREGYEKLAENHPVLANVVGNATEVLKPVGSVYALVQGMRGEDIDPNSPLFNPNVYKQAVTETTKENIEANSETELGRVLKTGAYDVGMGLVDNAVRMLTFGGVGSKGTTAAMGFSAIGDTAKDVAENKGNNRQALTMGILNGAIEVATEYLPMERLMGTLQDANRQGWGQALRNLGAGMLEEGVGEGLSEFFSILADNAVMGAKSDTNQRIQDYMVGGMSYEEAAKQVFKESLGQIGYSGAIGAITGGVMQGGAQLANTVGTIPQRRALKQLEQLAEERQQEMQKMQQAALQQEEAVSALADDMLSVPKQKTATTVEVVKPEEMQQQEPKRTKAQETMQRLQTETAKAKRRTAQVEAVKGDEGLRIRKDNADVDLSDLDSESADARMLNAAQDMSADATNDMLSLYEENGEATAEQYAKGYQAAYAVGLSGQDVESAHGLYMDDLTDAQRKSAWLEGYKQRTQQETRIDSLSRRYANEAGLDARVQGRHNGVSLESVTRKLSSAETMQLQLIDQFAKKYNIDVRVFDTLKGGEANAYIKRGTNEVHIALDAQDSALTRVMSHELYHFVEQNAGEDAKAIRAYVLDKLRSKEGYDLDERIEEITERYQRAGVETFDAESEIVADGMLDIIGTEENLREMAKNNKNLLQKIKDHIQALLDFVRDTLRRASGHSEEVRALMDDADYMQEIVNRMNRALENAAKNYETKTRVTAIAKQNGLVQGYLQTVENAENAEARKVAADNLVQNLMYVTQESVLNATGDMDGTLEAFRDTLQRFANGEGQLDNLLRKAGLNATTDELRPVVAYAARALKNAGEEMEVYNLNSFGMEELNKESKNNIKMRGDVLITTREELLKHIDAALDGEEQKNLYLGAVPETTKNRIENDTGVSMFKKGQYAFSVTYDAIRHIEKHSDTRTGIADEIERVYAITNEYDSVKHEYDAKKANKLIFEKTYENADYLAVEVASKANRAFELTTEYITKKHKNRGQSGVTDTSNGPGAPRYGSASNAIIDADTDSVNGKDYSLKSDPETEKAIEKAVKQFGTTDRFEEAGYILPDGRLLRMTDEAHKGERWYDHRAIAMAYGKDVDLNKDHGHVTENGEYMDRFVNGGAIRFDSGEPDLNMDIGLQISSDVPLTKAQERTIRDLVEWKDEREDAFVNGLSEDDREYTLYNEPLAIRIDFGANSNYAVGSASAKDLAAWGKKALEYQGKKISANQIIHDVRRYFETGETNQRSELSKFYSLKRDPETEQKYQEIFEKRQQLRDEERQLQNKMKAYMNDETTLKLMDRLMNAETREERRAAASALKEHEVQSGVGNIQERIRAIEEEKRALSKEEDELRAKELQRTVENSGMTEAAYFEKAAVKEFGYTPYFVDAGYILSNGKMLNFSGEKGKHYGMRGQDHRAVSTLFEGTKSGTDSLTAFMNYGNVRIMDETPGVDMSTAVEPTAAQIATIKKHVRESAGRGLYMVDFSDENGRSAGALTYEGRVSADRVANDILHFYETGEIREQSELSKFYSLKSDNNTYFDEVTYDQDVRDAGRLVQHLLKSREKAGFQMGEWRGKTGNIAKKILEETGSAYAQNALTGRINKAYEAIDRAGGDREAIMAYCYDIGKKVAENAGEIAEVDPGRQQARDYLRGTKIYLNAEMQSEVKATYGSVQAFMRRNFGKAKFTTDKKATGLEEMWSELHDLVPSVFKEDTQLGEMPMIVEAFLESSGKVNRVYYNATEEQIAQDVAMRLFWEYFQMPGTYSHLQEQEKEMVQRISDTMDSLRDTFEQRVQERITQREEREEKARQRTMLERTVKQLDRKLRKPTKQNHIPEQYRGAVAAALELVNTSGNRKGQETRTARYNALLGEIAKLRENDSAMAHIDPDMEAHIEELKNKAAGKSIMVMNAEELKTLNDIMRNIQHACVKSDQLLTAGRQTSLRKMASAFHENMATRGDRKVKGNLGTAFEKIGRSMQDAPRFFNELARVGGEGARELWEIIRFDGLDTQIRLVEEAEKKMHEALDGYDYKKMYSENSGNTDFATESGNINLTKGQVMALYLLNKREQARNHIYGVKGEDGGIAQGRVKVGVNKYSESVRPSKVNEMQVKAIIDTLTEDEKAVADKMGALLSGWCADLGNEVSMQMYGYKKFTEANYFPIQVWDGRKSVTSGEQFKNDLYQIMNKGFTKELTDKAQAPLVVPDIFDAVTEHVNGMIMYRAWTAPVTDVIKFLNYKYTDETTETIDGVVQYVDGRNILGSVREDMDRVLGKAAADYMTQLLKDINGRSKNNVEKIWDKGVGVLTRNQKSSAVAANIGTMMKQPFSINRAFDVIPAYYFAGKPIVPTKKRAELIAKYAPIYYWKQQGNFTMDSGKSIQSILMPGLESAKNKFNELAMAGAGYMDNVTWHNIWAASERMVNAKIRSGKESEYAGLQEGTDPYYKKVAEIFNKCVDETQTVDSILHRTEVMRQDSALLKMLTSFMGEPLKTLNMMMDAVDGAKKKDVQSMRRLVRTGAVLGVSVVVQEMVNAMVSTLRNWDDEDKFWEQFKDAFLGEYEEDMTKGEKAKEFLLGSSLGSGLNILTYIPVARDLMETFSGYTVERMDMTLMSELVKAVQQLDSESKGDVKKVTDILGALGNLFGIPAGNIIKESGRIWNYVAQQLEAAGVDTLAMQYAQLKVKKDLGESNLTDYATLILKAEKQGNTDLAKQIRADMLEAGATEKKLDKKLQTLQLADSTGLKASDVSYEKAYGAYAQAVMSGDKDLAKQLLNALQSGGDNARDDKDIEDGVAKWLAENDERVMKAAKQKLNNDLNYTDVYAKIRADGFSDAVAKKAVTKAYNAIKPEAKEDKAESKEKKNTYVGVYDSADFASVVETKNARDAQKVIEDLRKQGKDDSSIKSSITNYAKDLYKQLMKGTARDKQEARKLKEMLLGLELKNKYTEKAIEEWLK